MSDKSITIRPAVPGDAASFLSIYAPYILNTAITYEYVVPTEEAFAGRIRHVLEKYPEATWWLHFHNTRGLAMANIMAAMEAGMTQFDGSFGGLGGCPFVPGAAGNISTEDVLHMCEESGIETGVDIVKLIELSRGLRDLLHHDTESYILRAGRSRDLISSQNN